MIELNRTSNTWIVEKHTRNLDDMHYYLKLINENKGDLSEEQLKEYLESATTAGVYKKRYKAPAIGSMKNKIGVLRAYNLGAQKELDDGRESFLIGPYGELFIKYFRDRNKLKKILLTSIYFLQYPGHKHNTAPDLVIYPWRLFLYLLNNEKLDNFLYADEVIYFLPFIQNIQEIDYEELVESILEYRQFDKNTKKELFEKEVNIGRQSNINVFLESGLDINNAKKRASEMKWADLTHTITYYLFGLLTQAGILDLEETEHKFSFKHYLPRAKMKTNRHLGGKYSLNNDLMDYFHKLSQIHPLTENVIRKDNMLETDFTFKLLTNIPEILLDEIEEKSKEFEIFTALTKAVHVQEFKIDEVNNIIDNMEELSSTSRNMNDYTSFEDRIAEVMNLFENIDAQRLGGPGRTDVECLDSNYDDKFNIDGKTRRNTLGDLNPRVLEKHMKLNGALFTLVVTTAYTDSVLEYIDSSKISIVTTQIFAEVIRKHVKHNDLKDFENIRNLIEQNLGREVSSILHDYLFSKFGTTMNIS